MDEQNTKIGKFDSPDSLLRAYEALESEFTKRSQRLKGLERENERLNLELCDISKFEEYATNAVKNEDFLDKNVFSNDAIRTRIIEQYLVALNSANSLNVLSGKIGKSVLTPPQKPKSLSEAKSLADKIINQ